MEPPVDQPSGPTGPTGPETGATGPTESLETGPTYIITFDELKQTQEALAYRETLDKAKVFMFVEPDSEEVKRRLLQWAGLGFPDGFQISSISLIQPSRCADGVTRTKFQYVEYLLGTSLSEKVQLLQSKLPGMLLSYSLPDSQICLHVSKG